MSKKVAIVGAGLVGSLEAIKLAKRGFEVTVFERRGDLRSAEIIAGRSINLALSNRGWKALEGSGIGERIQEIAIPMHARMMHDEAGNLTEQAYGKDGEAIFSVSRGELNRQLLIEAGQQDNVSLIFHHRCVNVNLDSNTLRFRDELAGDTKEYQFDHIIGTDGAFSAIRNRLMRLPRFNYSQYYIPHGYKELTIPAGASGTHKIAKNYLHIWPRGQFMLIALPNLDGSFTCTLFFPYDGKTSFNSLETKEQVARFFEATFGDAIPHMPEYLDDYFENPTAPLVTIRCYPWNYQNKILIIGDASHAIVPFYGQGMNSGFEDTTVLEEMLDKSGNDLGKVIEEYSNARKADADAISELALRNFVEMRDLVADEKFLLQKKIEKKLHKNHPDKWVPLYSLVTFSHTPYSEALARGDRQQAIMNEIMDWENIADRWDSDEVEQAILEKI